MLPDYEFDLDLITDDPIKSIYGRLSWEFVLLNGSQLAKMKKYIPDMSLP